MTERSEVTRHFTFIFTSDLAFGSVGINLNLYKLIKNFLGIAIDEDPGIAQREQIETKIQQGIFEDSIRNIIIDAVHEVKTPPKRPPTEEELREQEFNKQNVNYPVKLYYTTNNYEYFYSIAEKIMKKLEIPGEWTSSVGDIETILKKVQIEIQSKKSDLKELKIQLEDIDEDDEEEDDDEEDEDEYNLGDETVKEKKDSPIKILQTSINNLNNEIISLEDILNDGELALQNAIDQAYVRPLEQMVAWDITRNMLFDFANHIVETSDRLVNETGIYKEPIIFWRAPNGDDINENIFERRSKLYKRVDKLKELSYYGEDFWEKRGINPNKKKENEEGEEPTDAR